MSSGLICRGTSENILLHPCPTPPLILFWYARPLLLLLLLLAEVLQWDGKERVREEEERGGWKGRDGDSNPVKSAAMKWCFCKLVADSFARSVADDCRCCRIKGHPGEWVWWNFCQYCEPRLSLSFILFMIITKDGELHWQHYRKYHSWNFWCRCSETKR